MNDNQSQNEVFIAIEEHIRNKTEYELFVLPGGTGHMMVIMKGISRGLMEKMDAEEVADGTTVEIEHLDDPDSEISKGAKDLWSSFGSKYPMFCLGETTGDMTITNSLCVHYGQSVILDYSHPEFFTYLDKVITHVLTHDDLSGFSLLS